MQMRRIWQAFAIKFLTSVRFLLNLVSLSPPCPRACHRCLVSTRFSYFHGWFGWGVSIWPPAICVTYCIMVSRVFQLWRRQSKTSSARRTGASTYDSPAIRKMELKETKSWATETNRRHSRDASCIVYRCSRTGKAERLFELSALMFAPNAAESLDATPLEIVNWIFIKPTTFTLHTLHGYWPNRYKRPF